MKRLYYLCLASILLACAVPVRAEPYLFTNILDSTVAAPTGNFLDIGDAAISGNKVAFKAGYNQGFLGIIDSIFTSSGGPRTTVVQELRTAPTGGLFEAIGRPAIEGNSVYFDARVLMSFPDGGDGVFYGEGLQRQDLPVVSLAVSPRLVPLNATYKVIADPLISDGYLAFRRSRSGLSVPDAIRIANPERTEFKYLVAVGDAAPQGETFSAIDANYGLSGATVAFRGFYGSQEGIFTGAGGPLTTIVAKGDRAPSGEAFDSVLDPAISGDKVAFLGTFADGSGIFTGDGGPLSTIVKSGDATPGGHTFSSFSVPAIGGGTVAFHGSHSGGEGIYTKTGAVLRAVVEIGDPFLGSSIASLNFSDLGLDQGGSGNLAFTYGLADGRTGIAMAVPGAGLPTIFQDLYGTIPVPDSVGITFVPIADFSGRNLTNAYLSGADLKNANARNVNLTGAYLRSADLTNADLRDANLTGARLDSARLSGANLNGANVHGARFTREFVVAVDGCFLDQCTYKVIGYGGITPAQLSATANYLAHDLSGIGLEGNNLTGANLAGQNLARADFTFATLTGANLTGADIRGASFGRYNIPVPDAIAVCDNFHPCNLVIGPIGTGITVEQLHSTASYQAHDLTGVNFGGNYLVGANFAGQNLTGANFSGSIDNSPGANLANANLSHSNLTNANFGGATLTGADLSAADARRAGGLGGYGSPNLIRPDGHVDGLDLNAGHMLSVRDYDGNPAATPALAPIAITVDQHFAMSDGGTLRMLLEADAWDSTISFAPGIPVALGGTLELLFADGTNFAGQRGRTFDLFNWDGVAPTGEFQVSSPYIWDLSNLYTTGEISLLAVPEPATVMLLLLALVSSTARRCLGARR